MSLRPKTQWTNNLLENLLRKKYKNLSQLKILFAILLQSFPIIVKTGAWTKSCQSSTERRNIWRWRKRREAATVRDRNVSNSTANAFRISFSAARVADAMIAGTKFQMRNNTKKPSSWLWLETHTGSKMKGTSKWQRKTWQKWKLSV